jgi:hypothetical protein
MYLSTDIWSEWLEKIYSKVPPFGVLATIRVARCLRNRSSASSADAEVVSWFYAVLLLRFVIGSLRVDGLHGFRRKFF